MTKRVAIYGLLIAVLTLAWAVVHYYSTETFAIWWHFRHGSHAELNGIRFPVPLAYEVSGSPGPSTLGMIRFAGRGWQGGGTIDIDFHKQPSPEAMRLMQSLGVMRSEVVGVQEATLAGKPGKCVEGIPETGDPRLDESVRKLDVLQIDCWFNSEVEVTFLGTPGLKDEFYSVIRGAARVEGKR